MTLLIVSAFLVKHSINQQNLPFQAQHWELQSISQEDSSETVFTYSLKPTEDLVGIACAATTLLLRDLEAPEPSVPLPHSGAGETENFFFMEEYFEFDHIQWL